MLQGATVGKCQSTAAFLVSAGRRQRPMPSLMLHSKTKHKTGHCLHLEKSAHGSVLHGFAQGSPLPHLPPLFNLSHTLR